MASRTLADPNFSETVVLVIAYGAEGASGLVINRRSPFKLSEVLPEVEGVATRGDQLYVGGPVEPGRILVLLRSGEVLEHTTEVFEDVYVTASAEALRAALGKNLARERLRIFSGYAGWGPGQLDAELERSDWYVASADVAKVFSEEPDKTWSQMIDRVAGQWVRGHESDRALASEVDDQIALAPRATVLPEIDPLPDTQR